MLQDDTNESLDWGLAKAHRFRPAKGPKDQKIRVEDSPTEVAYRSQYSLGIPTISQECLLLRWHVVDSVSDAACKMSSTCQLAQV